MNKLKVFDLDGTIIDSSHRYRINDQNKIDLEYWRDNCTHEKIMMDSLLPHYKEYKNALECRDTIVIIATARAMQKGDPNFQYINNVLGNPDHTIHRLGDQDTRKGTDLKTTGIFKAIPDISIFKELSIFEDNLQQLNEMTDIFKGYIPNVIPVYVESNQGH